MYIKLSGKHTYKLITVVLNKQEFKTTLKFKYILKHFKAEEKTQVTHNALKLKLPFECSVEEK